MTTLENFKEKLGIFYKMQNAIALQKEVLNSLFINWGLQTPTDIFDYLDRGFTIKEHEVTIHCSDGDLLIPFNNASFRDNVIIIVINSNWYLLKTENEVNGLFKS